MPLIPTLRRQGSVALVRGLALQRFPFTSLPYVSLEGKLNCGEETDPPQRERRNFIHPSAVVHPNAILGQGVSIGPFCTVGPSVKLGNACQLYPGSHVFGNTALGDNCILMVGAVVGDDLPGNTIIGCNNTIGHHAVVGNKCQDLKYKPGSECFLEIGSNNDIREHTSIHRSSKPNEKTDYAHTAGAIVVHQFCRIGSFSFVGGGSVVSQDVPNYVMVSGERAELRGLNVEGLRRRGFSGTEIRSLRTAYRKIFMPSDANSGSIEQRLVQVELDEALVLVPAVRSMLQSIRDSFTEDRRGICKFRSWGGS